MSESMINLWINSETNALLPNWNAFGTATLPPIKQGDKISFDIHWVKSDPSGQFMEEVIMNPSSTIKVAVGLINGGPSSGYFVYSYEGDTVEIPYDADVDSFPIVPPPVNYVYVEKNANTLINSLPSIIAAGGVDVYIVNERTFRIVFKQFGARALSSCDSTTLSPSTNVSVIRISAGSSTVKEVQHLRPKLLPVAYSDSFTNSPQPVISINDIDSITKRISISPAPKFGTFTISNGTGTTSALSVNASAGDVVAGLISAGILSSTRGYSVAKSGDYSWDIYRTSGTAETLTVSTSGIVGFSSKNGVIDFNTFEVEDLVAGQPSVNAVLEVEYSYGSVRQTLYQGRVTIVNDLIDAATYNPIPFPELNGGIGEAPQDGVLYGRKDGLWSPVNISGGNIPDYDNTVIYTVGSQVYYQGGLYRMIFSAGVADIEPSTNPTYWESLSGGDLSNYVSKTGSNEMDVGSAIVFPSSFGVTSISQGGVGVFDGNDINQSSLSSFGLQVTDADGTTQVMATGIAFPDSTIQTTAAVTPNLADYVSKSDIQPQTISSQINIPYGNSIVTSAINNQSGIYNSNGVFVEKYDGPYRKYTYVTRDGLLTNQTTGNIPYSDDRGIVLNQTNEFDNTLVDTPTLFLRHKKQTGTEPLYPYDPIYEEKKLSINTYGITFNDGSVQTTAANPFDPTGYATETWVNSRGFLGQNGGSVLAGQSIIFGNFQDGRGQISNGGIAFSEPLASGGGQNLIDLTNGLFLGVSGCGVRFPDGTTQTSAANPFDPTGYATESWVTSQGYITSSALVPYAPLASPAFSGVPTAPTPIASDNSNTIATTAYVTNAVASSTTSPSTEKVTKTVRNATTAIIPKGSVVYVSGANGTHPTILLARANSELTSYRTFGVTESDIAVNGDGSVVIIGEVADLNTGSFADGDQLYLSPTIAGGITNSKPSAPSHLVYVGVCTRANNSNGKIEVNITNGFELHELHDVAISLPKEDKQLVAYELSSNLWKNKSAATLGIAELSGATFNGKVNTPAPNTTNAGLNIGAWVGGPFNNSVPSSPVIGDLWIQRNNLLYIDAYGNQRMIPSLTTQNLFSANVPAGQGTAMQISNFSAGELNRISLVVLGQAQFGNAGVNSAVRITGEGSQPALFVSMLEAGTSDGLRITNRGTGNSLLVEDSLNPDATSFVINNNGDVGIGVPTTWTSTTKFEVNGKALLIPTNTDTPSLSLGLTSINSAPANAANGDLWITNAASPKLAYKTGGVNYYAVVANSFNTFTGQVAISGTSATNPQLAITQGGSANALTVTSTGTGNAIVVEDQVSPDTSSFVVNNAGNVGIGVNPSSFTPSVPLTVNGSIVSTTAPDRTSNTIVATTEFVKNAVVPSITSMEDGAWSPTVVAGWNSIYRFNLTYDQSVQLPTDSQSTVIVGTQIVFLQLSSGRLNFAPTNGNTVMSSGGKYNSNQQHSVVTAIKTGSNEWLIAGDLTT